MFRPLARSARRLPRQLLPFATRTASSSRGPRTTPPTSSSSPSPPSSFIDRKASLHEEELIHSPSSPQTLSSLTSYHAIHSEELRPLLHTPTDLQLHRRPPPYRYDVGHEIRFDPLHPPVLPHLDAKEIGPGDYDRALQENQLDPSSLVDPTNRTPNYSLRLLECSGYVTAARATALAFGASLAPAADVLAQGSVEVVLDTLAEGVTRTVKWRGKPMFIRHRTAHEIELAKRDDELARTGQLRDPELDEQRVKREDFLVVVAICTHLGCVPLGGAGDYHGYFCPCHGSHYDTSARIRKGPAPLNLAVPPYEFTGPLKIRLGGTV